MLTPGWFSSGHGAVIIATLDDDKKLCDEYVVLKIRDDVLPQMQWTPYTPGHALPNHALAEAKGLRNENVYMTRVTNSNAYYFSYYVEGKDTASIFVDSLLKYLGRDASFQSIEILELP